jgi:hypothetical protein
MAEMQSTIPINTTSSDKTLASHVCLTDQICVWRPSKVRNMHKQLIIIINNIKHLHSKCISNLTSCVPLYKTMYWELVIYNKQLPLGWNSWLEPLIVIYPEHICLAMFHLDNHNYGSQVTYIWKQYQGYLWSSTWCVDIQLGLNQQSYGAVKWANNVCFLRHNDATLTMNGVPCHGNGVPYLHIVRGTLPTKQRLSIIKRGMVSRKHKLLRSSQVICLHVHVASQGQNLWQPLHVVVLFIYLLFTL